MDLYCHLGGPHSCYVSGFVACHVAFSLLGFTVLLVNYRGSIGFGQASIDALLGHVGTMDIQDVQVSVSVLYNKYPFF
jgi:acylaminoacyl-peptidase